MSSGRRYQVREVLGEGAFGAVYLAHALGSGLQREVAVKVLHRDRADTPGLVSRLRDEARMLALIRHRAIVRVDDLVELDGAWSIVMEYVEGCDVAALLAAGPLPPRVAVTVCEEVANALHAAWHQAGPDGQPLRLVHRDIKPSNIRLTPRGEVKLLDFGVARAEFADREAGTTRTGFGTLTYMAAERFEGVDSQAGDVYALGVSLFEMLTGVPPGKLAADRDRQPPGSRLVREWAEIKLTSPVLHGLLASMLAYEPEKRPTARDCARALGNLRGHVPGEQVEDWAARVVPEVAIAGRGRNKGDARTGTILVERPPAPAPSKQASRRFPWAAAVLSLVLLTLAVGGLATGAWWALKKRDSARVAARPEAPSPSVATLGVAPPPPTVSADPPEPTKPTPVKPRTKTTPRPAPPPEPEAEPPERGTIVFVGDPITVRLRGAAGTFTGSSAPAGTYKADITFDNGTTIHMNVDVPAGDTITLKCDQAFFTCSKIAVSP